jgi:predicted MFS family arabinose efflux permease
LSVTESRLAGVRLLVPLAAVTIASQFFRASGGAIAPELTRDLGLTPSGLALANAAFFMSFLVSQIPLGMLFDRIGPRLTVTALSALTVAGALLHAAAASPEVLVVSRALIGLGCAGSFMAAVVLCARWYAADRFATMLSRIFAASNLGYVIAGTPWVLLASAVGWRSAFVVSAVASAALGVVFYVLVRDAPPSAAPLRRESLPEIVRGLRQVWTTPGLLPIVGMHTVAYASMLTVLSLWAGPYLHDVYGLDAVERGNVVLVMGIAQIVGVLAYGPLDRVFDSRKRVVMAGGILTVATLTPLAAAPSLPAWAAASLLVLLCLVTAYGVLIVAHGRSLFPPHLIGRGVTTVNLAQVVGVTLMPIITGFLVGLFPQADGMSPPAAYRVAFAAIAVSVVLGLAGYSRAGDARPSDDGR